MNREQALDVIRDRLAQWRAKGVRQIGAADLKVVLAEVGRSRSWLYGVLRELEDKGALEQVPGVYPWRWEIR